MNNKVHDFHFRLKLDLPSHINVSGTLLIDFEAFDNF